jgi:hypothetical protein
MTADRPFERAFPRLIESSMTLMWKFSRLPSASTSWMTLA